MSLGNRYRRFFHRRCVGGIGVIYGTDIGVEVSVENGVGMPRSCRTLERNVRSVVLFVSIPWSVVVFTMI